MRPSKSTLILLTFAFPLLIACGGEKSEEEIEKKAKESANKAADESLQKLNKAGEADSSMSADTSRGKKGGNE